MFPARPRSGEHPFPPERRIPHEPDGAPLSRWTKRAPVEVPTASVLWSGREVPAVERPQGQLVSIDVRTAKQRVLATGNVRNLHLSPNQRYLAVVVEVGRRPPDSAGMLTLETVHVDLPRTRLAIVDLGGQRPETRWIEGVRDPKPDWYDGTFRQWAPNGTSFAVIGRVRDTERSSETLFVVQAATGRVDALGAKELVVRGVAWTRGGDLDCTRSPPNWVGSARSRRVSTGGRSVKRTRTGLATSQLSSRRSPRWSCQLGTGTRWSAWLPVDCGHCLSRPRERGRSSMICRRASKK